MKSDVLNRLRQLLIQGDYDSALALIVEEEKTFPEDPDFFSLRGDTYLALGDYEEAVLSYQNQIRCDPAQGSGYRDLGYALFFLNRSREAIFFLNKALTLQGTDVLALERLGMVHFHQEQYQKAESCFLLLLKLKFESVALHYYMGEIAYFEGQYAQALLHFERARILDGGDRDVLFSLAQTLEALERDEEAEAIYTRLMREEENADKLFHVLVNLAVLMFRNQNLVGARRNFERSLQIKKDSVLVLNNLGYICMELGDYALAESHLQSAVKLEEDFNALLNLGRCYLKLHQPIRAELILKRALSQCPKGVATGVVYFLMGKAYVAQSRYRIAMACFQISLEQKGYKGENILLYLEVATLENRLDQALKFLLRLRHRPLEYFTALFLHYTINQQMDKALRVLQAGIRKFPAQGKLYYYRATVHALMGRTALAVISLQKALKFEPSLKESLQRDLCFKALRQDSRVKALVV